MTLTESRSHRLLHRFRMTGGGAVETWQFGRICDPVFGGLPLQAFRHRGPAVAGLTPLRLAVFALVHGDEPAGGEALASVWQTLLEEPERLRNADLYVYPLCNPSGYERSSRTNAGGADLNREFWRGSTQVEVQCLEAECRRYAFDGYVALHADCDSEGLYAFARGPVTSEELLMPALTAAEAILPRNAAARIDGFAACDGVIRDCYPGVLAPPPGQTPAPFEIIFETPGSRTVAAQAEAAAQALLALLAELPRLAIGGPDI